MSLSSVSKPWPEKVFVNTSSKETKKKEKEKEKDNIICLKSNFI